MKRVRQYIGILAATAAYYLVHEGAHLLCAALLGVFKQIRLMGIGMQIDVHAERMADGQMALFCIAGAAATLVAGIVLAALAGRINRRKSKLFRAIMYYITIVLLLLDPLYLSILCGFFGGGDMNGISLLCPEWIARSFFAVLFIINGWIFWKRVLPVYKESFSNEPEI
jgi:MFS family permease